MRRRPAIKNRRIAEAAARIERRAGGPIDVALVLGSGLAAGVRARIEGLEIAYEKLDAPAMSVAGHPGIAYVGAWTGKRVAAFAGRAHLYEGHTPADVTYFVRLAACAGAKTIVLTNAAGALDADFAVGDVMLVADHLNLTGVSPLEHAREHPFLDMTNAYAPHLRSLARAATNDARLREGVYAGVRGPQYETPAEAEALRRLGADAVGMSTVLETIVARSLGLDVLGLSLITNTAAFHSGVSHAEVLAASAEGSDRIALIIEATLAAL